MTTTTYRVVWYDPEDIWEDMSDDFTTIGDALAHANANTDVGHAVVERVEVTPLYAYHNILKVTEIT